MWYESIMYEREPRVCVCCVFLVSFCCVCIVNERHPNGAHCDDGHVNDERVCLHTHDATTDFRTHKHTTHNTHQPWYNQSDIYLIVVYEYSAIRW